MVRANVRWSWIEIFKTACLIAGYAGLGMQFGWSTAAAFVLINYGHRD